MRDLQWVEAYKFIKKRYNKKYKERKEVKFTKHNHKDNATIMKTILCCAYSMKQWYALQKVKEDEKRTTKLRKPIEWSETQLNNHLLWDRILALNISKHGIRHPSVVWGKHCLAQQCRVIQGEWNRYGNEILGRITLFPQKNLSPFPLGSERHHRQRN